MSITDKIAVLHGAGHNVPQGLADILVDIDKRLTVLEKPKDNRPDNKPDPGDELS
jgi:hypothetical protein